MGVLNQREMVAHSDWYDREDTQTSKNCPSGSECWITLKPETVQWKVINITEGCETALQRKISSIHLWKWNTTKIIDQAFLAFSGDHWENSESELLCPPRKATWTSLELGRNSQRYGIHYWPLQPSSSLTPQSKRSSQSRSSLHLKAMLLHNMKHMRLLVSKW